ncbi:MAG: DegT/DnrJ/EryC1/StrS family aminotransferase [Vicinamibacteraceae bacterium]
MRHVAPAGTPIGVGTLGRWAARAATTPDAVDRLAAAICDRMGVTQCTPTVTGRAALVLVLRALARLGPAERTEVVIPSYTCYTVAASVLSAGLRVRVVDVDPRTLDFDRPALEQVDFRGVLAIVPTNLFGMPSDLPYLEALARAHGVRLVDDAAQAMGASVGGRLSGTWGDAGLYSLDKGKNITAIEGGLAVTRDPDVAAAMRVEAQALTAPAAAQSARDAVKLLAYAVLLRPWLYWIPNSLPQLQLGTTPYLPVIPFEQYNRLLAAMGLVMLDRLDDINAARVATAARVADAAAGAPGLTTVPVVAGGRAVYLRYPLLADTRERRDLLIERLRVRGIGATGSYPTSIVDIPELSALMAPFQAHCPGGRSMAERILTLPTHAFVSGRDLSVIHDTLHAPGAVTATSVAAAAPGGRS